MKNKKGALSRGCFFQKKVNNSGLLQPFALASCFSLNKRTSSIVHRQILAVIKTVDFILRRNSFYHFSVVDKKYCIESKNHEDSVAR